MFSNQYKLLIGAGALLLLSACDNSSNNNSASTAPPAPTAPVTPVTPATPQAQISAQFATDFNASVNSTPVKPASSDVPAVTLTGTPIATH